MDNSVNQPGKTTIRLLIYVLSILVITACASQRYAKLALKNEQAGLYEDAAELYLKSLNADKENIDAKIGAKKNGQLTLDDKLRKFSKSYVAGDSGMLCTSIWERKNIISDFHQTEYG